MDRYSSTMIQSSFNGKQTYGTTLYPLIPPADNDIYIFAKDTDRLDFLAQTYYKDKSLWWIIAQANALGKGTLSIPTGMQLRIPSNITQVIQNFIEQNS